MREDSFNIHRLVKWHTINPPHLLLLIRLHQPADHPSSTPTCSQSLPQGGKHVYIPHLSQPRSGHLPHSPRHASFSPLPLPDHAPPLPSSRPSWRLIRVYPKPEYMAEDIESPVNHCIPLSNNVSPCMIVRTLLTNTPPFILSSIRRQTFDVHHRSDHQDVRGEIVLPEAWTLCEGIERGWTHRRSRRIWC